MDNLSIEELEKEIKRRKENNKYIKSESGNFSKKILRLLFLGFILFVVAILVIFVRTGSEPSVLVGAVITFLSVEVWQLARIKIAESKEEENV